MTHLAPAPDALIGKRFDVAVAKMLGISRAKASDLVASGQARVLGRDVAKSGILQAGDMVEFDLQEERHEPEPIADDMRVVYEDAVCWTAGCISPRTVRRGGRGS